VQGSQPERIVSQAYQHSLASNWARDEAASGEVRGATTQPRQGEPRTRM